jgi:predicted ester cyclase
MSRRDDSGAARRAREQRNEAPATGRSIRRAIIPLALVLALVTGILLAETRMVMLAPTVTVGEAPQEDANVAVVRRFYSAVNELIRTGNDDPLDRVVAGAFVERTPPPGLTTDREGLTRRLQSIRAIAPAAQVIVIDLLAQTDRVVARVRLDGADDVAFLGLPVTVDQIWGTVDVFRVRSGEIIEHWGDRELSSLFDPMLAAAVAVSPSSRTVVTLERWSFAAGADRQEQIESGSLVVLVESGTLAVTIAPDSPAAALLIRPASAGQPQSELRVAPDEETTLRSGDALVLPGRARYALTSTEAASALVVSLIPFRAGKGTATSGGDEVTPETRPRTNTSGITRTVLAGGMTIDLPSHRVTVDIGRATLAPAAILPSHRVDVAELIAVETGSLALTVDNGTAWIVPEPAAAMRTGASATLSPGGGALVPGGTTATYQAEGTSEASTLLIVRVRSAAARSP